MNFLISFTVEDFASLMYFKQLAKDENKKKILDELIEDEGEVSQDALESLDAAIESYIGE